MMPVDDNIVRNVKSKSGSVPGCLGCEEGFKHAGLNFIRNARTIICDLDKNVSFL